MGQIIGGAAKPKRCNLNQLSQLGTPAAGEHILVSSDNSMNAAGQGNFDAYVVGDGQKAAVALPLKPTNNDKALITLDASTKNNNAYWNGSTTLQLVETTMGYAYIYDISQYTSIKLRYKNTVSRMTALCDDNGRIITALETSNGSQYILANRGTATKLYVSSYEIEPYVVGTKDSVQSQIDELDERVTGSIQNIESDIQDIESDIASIQQKDIEIDALLDKVGIVRVNATDWNYNKYYYKPTDAWNDLYQEVCSEISVRKGDRVTIHCKQWVGRINVLKSADGYITYLTEASSNADAAVTSNVLIARDGKIYIATKESYINESYVIIERNSDIENELSDSVGYSEEYNGISAFENARKYYAIVGSAYQWTTSSGVAVANFEVSAGDVVHIHTALTNNMFVTLKETDEDTGTPLTLSVLPQSAWSGFGDIIVRIPYNGYISVPCRCDNYFNKDAFIIIGKEKQLQELYNRDDEVADLLDEKYKCREFFELGYFNLATLVWQPNSMMSTKVAIKKGQIFRAYLKTYATSPIVIANEDKTEPAVVVTTIATGDAYELYEGVAPKDGYLFAPTLIQYGYNEAYVEIEKTGRVTSIEENVADLRNSLNIPDIIGGGISAAEFSGEPIVCLESKYGDSNYPYENIGFYFGNVVKISDNMYYMYYYGLGTAFNPEEEIEEGHVTTLFAWSSDGKTFTRGFPTGVTAPIAGTNRFVLRDANGNVIDYGVFSGQVFKVLDDEYPFRFISNSYMQPNIGVRMYKSRDGITFDFAKRISYGSTDNTLSCINRGSVFRIYGRGYKTDSQGQRVRTISVLYCDTEGNLLSPSKNFFGEYFYQASASALDDRRELLLPTKFGNLPNNNQQQHVEGFIVDGQNITTLNIDDSLLLNYTDGGEEKVYPSVYVMCGIFHEADAYYATDKMYIYYMVSERRHDWTYSDTGKAYFKRIELKLL